LRVVLRDDGTRVEDVFEQVIQVVAIRAGKLARGCDVSQSPCQPALGDRERSESSWPLRHIAAT
jgi:hypothetical protein